MTHLIFLIGLLIIFVVRKSSSYYYFSPTGFLCATWMAFVLLMWFFAPEYYFSTQSAFYIFLFIFCFFLGESFNNLSTPKMNRNKKRISLTPIFKRNFERGLKWLGVISVVGSVLYMFIYAAYFGGIMSLFTAGWAIRGVLLEGDVLVPFYVKLLLLPAYSNVILVLVYFIVYSKFRWYLLLPFFALFLMGAVQAGRAGFMLVIFQVYISLLFSYYYKNFVQKKIYKKEVRLVYRSVILVFITALIFVGGDMLRTQNFKFNVSSLEIFKQYLFGGISAFSTFLKQREWSEIHYSLGKFSFSALFDILGISKNEVGVYTDYLRISSTDPKLTTNIFTAFRQYIDDFGVFGTCILMYFFGMICNYFFKYATQGYLNAIAVSIVLYTILFHTPLLSISVHNSILLSLFLPGLCLTLFQLKAK